MTSAIHSDMLNAAGVDDDDDDGTPHASAGTAEGAGSTFADPFSLRPLASHAGQTPTLPAADMTASPVEPPPPGLESGDC